MLRTNGYQRFADHPAQRVKSYVLMIVATVVFASCRDIGDLGIDPAVAFPVSAQYDARRNELLVASYENGEVWHVPLASLDKPTVFLRTDEFAEHRVLRIRIDARRDRLWVLTFDAVYLYELGTGRLIQRTALPTLFYFKKHCFADMAVDHTGAAFISSTLEPMLFRVDGDTFTLTTLNIDVGADANKDFGFNALTFVGDGRVLLAASSALGQLWRIDTGRMQAIRVNISSPIRGACALSAVERMGPRGIDHRGDVYVSLYVAGGFKGGVRRIDLRPAPQRGWVSNLGFVAHLVATTDLLIARNMMLIVHSPLMSHKDFDGDGAPAPVKIVPIFQPLI